MENYNKKLFLPEELILESLMRLPIKSLVRFRCVSKSWLSLITDPQFTKLHLELDDAPSVRLIYLTKELSMEAQSIDLEASLNDESATVMLHPRLPTPDFGFRIMGSCRGFILLHYYSKNFVIWNPSTGVHRTISYSPVAMNIERNMRGSILVYGFGYDAAIDDYLVVIVSLDTVDKVTHLELFSIRANSWKETKGIHFPYSGISYKNGFFFNGAIHWICRSSIIMFDLIQRKILEIHLPNGFIYCRFNRLRIVGGCLSLCSLGLDNTKEIWVMKEHKVESSWTKVFVVPIHDSVPRYFSPLCFTKNGEVVGLLKNQKIVKLNDKAKLLEDRAYFEWRHAFQAAIYTESLLSLPSDCGEATEDDKE